MCLKLETPIMIILQKIIPFKTDSHIDDWRFTYNERYRNSVSLKWCQICMSGQFFRLDVDIGI